MEELKKAVRFNQMGKEITDQFYVDGDVNVPDAKSDVAKVVLGEGDVEVQEIQRVENYVRLSGKIGYKILYATDQGEQKLSSIQGKLPFEEMVYVEEEAGEQPFIKTANADLTVTLIHSRKLSLKTMVEIELSSEKQQEKELTLDAEDEEQLYKKFSAKDILKLHLVKKDTYRIKEEMSIPGTKENIGTLLWTEVASRKLDTRLQTDELILRGELQVFCLYESLEGKIDWVEQMVPYEGRIPCQGADETMFHHLYTELTDENIDVRMDEDGEMRIFGIEATLEVRLAVYQEEKMEILEDVYALRKVCKPEIEDMSLESLVMQNHSKCKVAEQLSLPELKDDILQICHCNGYLQTERTEIVKEGVLVEGVLHVSFLYIKADDAMPFDIWQGMVPFSHVIESNEVANLMRYDITHALEQLSVGLLGSDEVEIKALLSFHIFLRKIEDVANIQRITMEPIDAKAQEKAPGIVGYMVKEGDELWNLAKKYSTTVEGIMEVNDMSTEELKTGDKLLIFKENMSIL